MELAESGTPGLRDSAMALIRGAAHRGPASSVRLHCVPGEPGMGGGAGPEVSQSVWVGFTVLG